jgi:ATP-binding cassette subfamily B (MDR/TAP) protein 1
MKDLDIFSDRDPVKPDLDAVVYSTRKDNIKEEHPLVEEQTKMADEKIVTNEDEKKAEAPPANKMLPFPKLFMFSSICDKTIVAFGFILAVTGGAVAPVMSLVFGKLIDIFDPRKTDAEISAAFLELFWYILGISIILWTAGYFQYAFMQHMAEKLSFDLRSRYLRSLMNQETAYFEK